MINLSTKSRLCAAALLGTTIAVLSAPTDADQPLGRGPARGAANQARGASQITQVQNIGVAGTPVRLRLWDQLDASGNVAPHYAISLDGRGFSEPRATSYEIKLRHLTFDPLSAHAQPTPPWGFESGEDTNSYIVQFVTQPLPEFREAIRDLGGDVYMYLARHSHIVVMEPEVRDAVEALPFVRWVGDYHPSYRLEGFLVDNAYQAEVMYPDQRYNIMIHQSSLEEKEKVAQKIEDLGGFVHAAHAGKYLVNASMSPETLWEVARFDEVLFIDRWGPMEADMNNSRIVSGANHVELMAGYTGQGVRVESFDTGFNMGHIDLQTPPLQVHGANAADSHGAACIGVMVGDGIGDPDARGILPDGEGIVSYYSGIMGSHPARYDHTGELVDPAGPYRGVLQTASVGSPRTFFYDTISSDNDAGLFDFDVTHCQSQSNAGNQDSRSEAWSKNVISGGGTYHYNTADKSDDCWCSGGSTGPAQDGRIKPDMCHFYDDTLTTYVTSGNGYGQFGGTSGATPNICGYTGLFYQMWSEGIFGNEVDPFGDVFDNRSHMTTAKAVMINTSEQYPFSGLGHDHTRTHQGWGMPHVGNLYDLRDKIVIIDEDDVLGNLETKVYVVSVAPGESELKVTMTFADPPGNPAASEARINDLSLRVVSPGGTIYWGNNGLLENNYSTSGGFANTVDTVECVFVQNPQAGAWIVEVIASEIIQDGHVETPELDADYALVVSPATLVTDAGVVSLNSSLYPCDSTASISLNDAGLNLNPLAIDTHSVVIDSDSEPGGESVLLTETAVDSAAFAGSIALDTTNSSGVLLVSAGDTVTVTYIDADDGQGGVNVVVTDTATVDCTSPIISAIQTTGIGPFDAWVEFATDEDARGDVHYGTSCAALTETATQPGYGTAHAIHLTGLQENTTYYYAVDVEDGAGNTASDNNGGLCYTFNTSDIPLYFTEIMTSFDLDGYTLTLVPNGTVDYYVACLEPAVGLPTDPTGGTYLTISDDGSSTVVLPMPVDLYGTSYGTVYVNANGNITFDSTDSDYTETIDEHFSQVRIAALWDDLNPANGGTISWIDTGDRLAVSYEGVPEYSATGSNTFQIEMFYDGTIRITWAGIGVADALVGISDGGGTPPAFYAMDLSALPASCESGPCPEDIVAPAGVEQQDLNAVLNRWGDPDCLFGGPAYPCVEDLALPIGVEQQDLNAVLNRWGDPDCE